MSAQSAYLLATADGRSFFVPLDLKGESTMLRKFVFVSILPVLLAVMMMVFGYPGSTPAALAGAGDLVPLGDQLGDVGQYYSQISPNLNTNAYIYNTSSTSENVKIEIYDDVGTAITQTVTCTVAANRVLTAKFDWYSSGDGLDLSGGTGGGCTDGGIKFHGLYHMKITQTSAGSDLAVAVENWTNTDTRQVTGAYQAVPEWAVNSEYVLPAVVVYRDSGWDTEIVVQNTSGTTNTVAFSWVKDGESTKYSNNTATLAVNERRIFLASQLMYAGSGGSLTEKDGWAWMKVAGSGNMAITSNVFKQGLTNGKYRAEYGSERMMSFEAPLAGTELFVPGFVVNGTNSYFRVANASGSTASITAKLYNSSGSQVGSTYSPSLGTERAGVYASNVFGASNGTYTLRIQSSYNVTAAAWHENGGGHTGVTAQRVGDTSGGNAYFPFYWENYYSWQDDWQFTEISSPSPLPDITASAYKHSDGSLVDSWIRLGVPQYSYTDFQFSGGNDDLYGKYYGNSPLIVGQFENYSTSHDRIVSYNGIAKTDDVWYVPFAPSPVVQFAWSTNTDPDYPDATEYGMSGNPEQTGSPSWAKTMNWYSWNLSRETCKTSTQYIPMDWGLGGGWGATYNTSTRLNTVRNLAPSACAGRPFLLANEPNYPADQANMTHVEVARQVFVYRSWPGELYSPAYGVKRVLGSGVDVGIDHDKVLNDGMTDPDDTDYADFKTYWNTLSFGGLPYDGLAIHLYFTADQWGVDESGGTFTMASKAQNEIAEWATEATALGVKVLVTEYGMIPFVDPTIDQYCTLQCMADRIAVINTEIQEHLGTTIKRIMPFVFRGGLDGNIKTVASINTTDTTIRLTSGDVYTNTAPSYKFSLFDKNTGNEERLTISGLPTQLGANDYRYTVTRGVDGTGADSWSAGVYAYIHGIEFALSDLFYLSGGTWQLTGIWGVAWEDASD
ncbi:MAG: hypothetical protein KF753_18295 [Caldilineaceae bacterium]|nr:hypothetical protein [Caldilineaceae bacterium]